MSDGIKEAAAGSLIAAAAMSVGQCAPAEWDRKVLDKALSLARMIPTVVERFEVLESVQPVRGVLAKVEVERSSGRGLITTYATMGTPQQGQEVVNGRAVEHFRTDFVNTPAGQALVAQAQSLIGRHCRFGKRIEDLGQKKVRMVEWIEDIGPDPDAQGAPAPRQSNERPSAPSPAPRVQNPAPLATTTVSADWYVENGWRDKEEHDATRKAINDFAGQAPDDVKAKFKVWRAGRIAWGVPWPAEEAMLAKSRLNEFADEAEQAEMAMAGGHAIGEPVYEYGGEPF